MSRPEETADSRDIEPASLLGGPMFVFKLNKGIESTYQKSRFKKRIPRM